MRRTNEIGKNIYPKLTVDLDEVDKFLNTYGIKIYWLLEDGIMFEYPDTMITKNYPGDISFYAAETNSLILTYIENFGCLEFLIDGERVVYSIPIIE